MSEPAAGASTTGVRERVGERAERVTLRGRLIVIVLAVLALALVLTTALVATAMYEDLVDRTDRELATVASTLTPTRQPTFRVDNPTPTTYLVVVSDLSGDVLQSVTPTGEKVVRGLPRFSLDNPRVRDHAPFTVTTDDGRWRFVAGTFNEGTGTYAIGVSLKSVQSTVLRTAILMLTVGLGVIAMAFLLARYAVERAFQPLREIEDTAAAIAGGQLTRRIPIHGADDEVSSLSRSLNAMLGQLMGALTQRKASEDRMRQFVADASHELRTPLATIRGYAELYAQGAVHQPDDVAAAMDRIDGEAKRMSGLVEDLLMLARLDESPTTALAPVDLTVLAADAVADARVREPDRPIRVVGRDGPMRPTLVWGNDPGLRQVLTNLVANALRHTPAGTPVEVAVGTIGSDRVVEVRDHGPGLTPGTEAKVFERFYRADKSRGRAAGGGNGLGLAIVAAIVAQHGGRVGVSHTPGGGATFIVSFPEPPVPTADSQRSESVAGG